MTGGIPYYYETYTPVIKICGSLYCGWTWSNVNEFDVELSFYYLDENGEFDVTSEPILFGGSGEYSSEKGVDMYSVFSLNPESEGVSYDWTSDGREIFAHHYGPEYVYPYGNNDVYVYDKESSGWKSLIGTAYEDPGGNLPTQYGYYCVDRSWGIEGSLKDENGNEVFDESGELIYIDDHPSQDKWPQAAVVIVPQEKKASTRFTLGNMLRTNTDGLVYRSNCVWASISTLANEVPPEDVVDITINKVWNGDDGAEFARPESIEIELWRKSKNASSTTAHEKVTTVEMFAADDWKPITLFDLPTTFENSEEECTYYIKEKDSVGYTSLVALTDEYDTEIEGQKITHLEFTITNTLGVPSMPVTGGMGNSLYYIFGVFIIALALSGFAIKNKNKKFF